MRRNRPGRSPALTVILLAASLTPVSPAWPEEPGSEGAFYFNRGEAHLRRLEYAQALREYQRAARLEPGNERFLKAIVALCERFGDKERQWRQMADFYKHGAQYGKALFFFEKLLARHPRDVELLNAAGDLHAWRKQYAQALERYHRSLVIRRNAGALRGKGDVAFFQGRLNAARQAYEEALSLEPLHLVSRRRLAQIHDRQGRLEEALAQYRAVLKVKENDAGVWVELGWLHERKGEMEQAEVCYRRAAEFDPDRPDARMGWGRALMMLGKQGWAERRFREALERAAGLRRAEALNGLGWLRAWQGDGRRAKRFFRRALELDPLNSEARAGMGWVDSRSGRYDEALRWYAQVKDGEHPSSNLAAAIGLGWVYTQQGKYDKALSAYRQALSLAPRSVEALNGLGDLALRRGHPESAFGFFERSLLLKERNPEAYHGLARLCQRRGDYGEAVFFYRKAIAYRPLDPVYRNGLVSCYLELGADREALQALEHLAAAGVRNEEVWIQLGRLKARFGRPEEARECYRRVLSDINARAPDALVGLGDVSFRGGDYDRALREYRQALRLDPNRRGAHRGLALVYKETGRYKQAIERFRTLIAMKHNDVESWNQLGWIHRVLGDDERAAACYEKGLSLGQANPDGLIGLSRVYLEKIRKTPDLRERQRYYQAALGKSRQALAQAPDYADAYLVAAQLHLEMGNPAEARGVLQSISEKRGPAGETPAERLKALKNELAVLKALFRARLEEGPKPGQEDAGLQILLEAHRALLDLKVNDAETWMSLAGIYRMLKRYDRAEQTLTQAVESVGKEDQDQIRAEAAELHLLKGEINRAERMFRALAKRSAGASSAVHFGLGQVCESRGDSAGALRHYRRALKEHRRETGTDHKKARLALARLWAKQDRPGRAASVYERGLSAPPLDPDYLLTSHRELGEIYLKMGYLAKAEHFYRKALEWAPADFDARVGLADIARFRGRHAEAIGRYQDLLAEEPDHDYLRRMLANLHFWNRDWEKALEEHRKAGAGSEEDLLKVRKAGASRLISRFKYSESKQDDTGRQDFVTRTRAWDALLRYRHVLNNRWSFRGAFGYASVEERNLRADQVNFDIESDEEAVGFEYHKGNALRIAGLYRRLGYRESGLSAAKQRTPLRDRTEFHGGTLEAEGKWGRGSYLFRAALDPFRVKIFGSNPELNLDSRLGFLSAMNHPLGDTLRWEAAYGRDLYIPYGIERSRYRGGVTWAPHGHSVSLLAERKPLPLFVFRRSDGLRVLKVDSASVSYVNRWMAHLRPRVAYRKERYSDDNRADHVETGMEYEAPWLKGLTAGYEFRFSDHRFTAANVGDEPLYRSPQDLALHTLGLHYKSPAGGRLRGSAGYAFSLSSEDRTGHTAYLKGVWNLNDETAVNIEVERQDDASFSRETKALIYLTRHFF